MPNRWSRQQTTIQLNQARTADEAKRLASLPKASRTEQRVADTAVDRGTNNFSRRS